MRAYLLESPPLDAYAQMALDEAVLDLLEPDACALRVYRWRHARFYRGGTVHGVTFGCSQRFAEVEDSVRGRQGGVTFPLVRRCTGGGIVWHDGDVTFSFVFPWPRLSPPSRIYRDVHHGAHLGLKAHMLASRLSGRPSERRPAGLALECFAGPEQEDLVYEDGSKLLGGALRRRKGVGLYQGSMRAAGFSVPPERMRRALVEGFSLKWAALFMPCPPRPDMAAAAERLRQEKYSQDKWNQKR
ncbi:MAG: hypothetical protein ABII00_10495 [Elusimicrobiota bacterium]